MKPIPPLNQEQKKLVEANLKFVRKQANFFVKYRKLPWNISEELYHEGVLGMCRAAISFDPSKGVKFITYACHWINLYIRRGISKSKMIRIPNSSQEKDFTKVKDSDEFFSELILEECLEKNTEAKKMRSLIRERLSEIGIKKRDIDWYFQLIDEDLNQVEVANKSGVSKNTVKYAMYQIQDLIAEWVPELKNEVT